MADDFINVFYRRNDFTNFGAQLFRLIAKADEDNRRLLKKSFPAEVELYSWWSNQPNPSDEQTRSYAEFLELNKI